MEDTIAAVATTVGESSINVIRISGKDSINVANKIFSKDISGALSHTVHYGFIMENGEKVDEVLLSVFKSPKTFTTEDIVEISVHGGSSSVNKVMELVLSNGARLAEPGEFLKRAFLNGRIDLTQAESVIDLINAKSEKEKESAIHQLEGYLSLEIEKIKRVILDITADIEASIDYPEYDIEEKTNETIINETQKIVDMLKKLENSFEKGKILRDGVDVAIIGKPNAGKSSLLNAILKEERAIVTNIEGTTRDTIEEYITLEGVLFKIIDTAGIRESDDEIEKIGIDKSKKALEKADIVIAIFDSTQELNKEDKEILEFIKNKNAIILLNKIDLKDNKLKNNEQILSLNKPIIEISAQKRDGIEELYDQMINIFKINEINTENSTIITNVRHKNAIVCAEENLNKIKEVLNNGMPTDIVSIYLKNAIEELNKITGENVTEDIINEIFSKFCLGK